MNDSFEYNLYKKKMVLTLIIFFSTILICGAISLVIFLTASDIADEAAAVYLLIYLILQSFFLMPYVIYKVYDFINVKRILQKDYQEFIVVFKDIEVSLGRINFIFYITLNNGKIKCLRTKNYFRYSGSASVDNFMNKNVKIAYASNYEYAIVLRIM